MLLNEFVARRLVKLQKVAQEEMKKLEDLRKFSPKGDGKFGNAIIRIAKAIAKGGVSKQTTFLSKLDRIGLARQGMDMVEHLIKILIFEKNFGARSKNPAEAIEQAGMMQKRYLQWRDRKEFKSRQLAKFSQYKQKYAAKDPLLGLSMTIDQATDRILKLTSLLNLLVVDVDITLPVISATVTDNENVDVHSHTGTGHFLRRTGKSLSHNGRNRPQEARNQNPSVW